MLGGRHTGDGLSGATPSAKKTAQLMAYMRRSSGTRSRQPGDDGRSASAIKMYRSGSSVLGVPITIASSGRPTTSRTWTPAATTRAFWRGVIDGTTSQADALSQVGVRPGFGWITGTPHGNEPAGGEASVKELYELAARTDCATCGGCSNLDVFIQPVTRAGRPRPQRPHDGVGFDPNRDRGTVQMPENTALLDVDRSSTPGLFFIDAHQQTSGYFFPPNQDAALNEISHFALDLIQNVIGPGIQETFNDQSSAVPQLQHVRPLRPRVRRHRPGAASWAAPA